MFTQSDILKQFLCQANPTFGLIDCTNRWRSGLPKFWVSWIFFLLQISVQTRCALIRECTVEWWTVQQAVFAMRSARLTGVLFVDRMVRRIQMSAVWRWKPVKLARNWGKFILENVVRGIYQLSWYSCKLSFRQIFFFVYFIYPFWGLIQLTT